jgi:hypothetical protein
MSREGFGADDGIRTRDPHLGKVMLYQLSHVRVRTAVYIGRSGDGAAPLASNPLAVGLGLATPDAIQLAGVEREFEASLADGASGADLERRRGGRVGIRVGEEEVGIEVSTGRLGPPRQVTSCHGVLHFLWVDGKTLSQGNNAPETPGIPWGFQGGYASSMPSTAMRVACPTSWAITPRNLAIRRPTRKTASA